jgi:hypothetical protein
VLVAVLVVGQSYMPDSLLIEAGRIITIMHISQSKKIIGLLA